MRNRVSIATAVLFLSIALAGPSVAGPAHRAPRTFSPEARFVGLTTGLGIVSIHRLAFDRVDLLTRVAAALAANDGADEKITGNGLSDGPDPTDARSDYQGDDESSSDGDRTEEYDDAIDGEAGDDGVLEEIGLK